MKLNLPKGADLECLVDVFLRLEDIENVFILRAVAYSAFRRDKSFALGVEIDTHQGGLISSMQTYADLNWMRLSER